MAQHIDKITINIKADATLALYELALARLRAVAGTDTTAYLKATAAAAAAGITPDQIGLLAQSASAGPLKLLPMPTDRLPLLCRIRRHGWRSNPAGGPVSGGWQRQTCDRCAHLDLPTP